MEREASKHGSASITKWVPATGGRPAPSPTAPQSFAEAAQVALVELQELVEAGIGILRLRLMVRAKVSKLNFVNTLNREHALTAPLALMRMGRRSSSGLLLGV
jgi:hypothetical protein